MVAAHKADKLDIAAAEAVDQHGMAKKHCFLRLVEVQKVHNLKAVAVAPVKMPSDIGSVLVVAAAVVGNLGVRYLYSRCGYTQMASSLLILVGFELQGTVAVVVG